MKTRVWVPIDLPDDCKVEYVVALRTGRDGHPIREQLTLAGPVRMETEGGVQGTMEPTGVE